MPELAVAVSKRRPRRSRPRVKFPCGHLEGEAAVDKRTRGTERAVWVGCRSCNLIVVAVAVNPSKEVSRCQPSRT